MEALVTVIAIDGPAGAGKSTVARAVAARLGFDFLDTGAMYRAVALEALQRDIDIEDPDAVGAVAEDLDLRLDKDRVFIGSQDVSAEIRTKRVDRAVSIVSRHPRVRRAMVELQRHEATDGNDVVVEGRDIGSIVFPNAEVKVFLTASIDERARRRTQQLDLDDEKLEQIRASISESDELDSTRDESPLTVASEAIEVDTTGRTVEEVVEEIATLVSGP